MAAPIIFCRKARNFPISRRSRQRRFKFAVARFVDPTSKPAHSAAFGDRPSQTEIGLNKLAQDKAVRIDIGFLWMESTYTKEEKQFFFEKKNQKTFVSSPHAAG